jgi:sterol desaturase/sphingolipid hydroxylase (fatty acid hydroxylase superfamily)
MEHLSDFLIAVARHWIMGFRVDLIRYIVAAPLAWLVICVVLAPLLRSRKIRPDTPPWRQHVIEVACSVRSVAIFSTVTLATFALQSAGLFWGTALRMDFSPLWIAGSFALTVVAHDTWFYWSHRIMHRPALFRTFHRRHHRSFNPTPFTAYSFDIGEAAVMAAFAPLWLFLVPVCWPAFGLFMLHQVARNVIGHCGYELFPANREGRPLFDWMTTVTHHDLHHAQAGSNYGLYFTWWDRLMGTENPNYHARFADAVSPRRARRPDQTTPAGSSAVS